MSFKKNLETHKAQKVLDDLIHPDEVDFRLNWPPGRTTRLARLGRIPHYRLPDGSIRVRWAEINSLIKSIPADSHRIGVAHE